MPVSEAQSLPAHRFINALDEMTSLATVAIGFTGYQSGLTCSHLHGATIIMAVTVAVVIVLVVDLDQPARGFIRVPTLALVDVAKEIKPRSTATDLRLG